MIHFIYVTQSTINTATTTTESEDQTKESMHQTLFTLTVTQEQAERILFASTHGELSFGLLDEDSKVKPGPGVSLSNLFR